MGLNRIGQFADSMRDCLRPIAARRRADWRGGDAAGAVIQVRCPVGTKPASVAHTMFFTGFTMAKSAIKMRTLPCH